MRARLNIDPVDRPLSADADALIVIERGVPRFEGTVQLTRVPLPPERRRLLGRLVLLLG